MKGSWKQLPLVIQIFTEDIHMQKLDFYLADEDYVKYLREAEMQKRGFTRIPKPNSDYPVGSKLKFLCGIVFKVDNINYYVPVSSYKKPRPNNILIELSNGTVVGSLRFNYMFPIPDDKLINRNIDSEPDKKYRSLLSQELLFCRKNQEKILRLARNTYNKVINNYDEILTHNSCDFKLLEQKCFEYEQQNGMSESEEIEIKNTNSSVENFQENSETKPFFEPNDSMSMDM